MTGTCPHCGYCQHCGRSNRPAPYYVPSPLPWQPWEQPWWVSPVAAPNTAQPFQSPTWHTSGLITIIEAGPNAGVTGIKGS
jgi:hypothetical protein